MDVDMLALARRTIQGIRAIEEAATPRPWRAQMSAGDTEAADYFERMAIKGGDALVVDDVEDADGAAIVILRNAAPWLLALAEAAAKWYEAEAEKRELVRSGGADEGKWLKYSARQHEAEAASVAAFAQLAALDGAP